jgi:hypothetical protein
MELVAECFQLIGTIGQRAIELLRSEAARVIDAPASALQTEEQSAQHIDNALNNSGE